MSSPAPVWLDDIVREFGRSAGLSDFSLNDRGAAAATFETGAQLRFEYAFESLVVALSFPYPVSDPAAARRLLAAAHPGARAPFRLRAGILARSGRAILAARSALRNLRGRKGPAAQRAARELGALLADTELFESYRAALLET